jgi:hypothetical protein
MNSIPQHSDPGLAVARAPFSRRGAFSSVEGSKDGVVNQQDSLRSAGYASHVLVADLDGCSCWVT